MKWSTFFKGLYSGLKVVLPVAKAAASAGLIRGDGGKVLAEAKFLKAIEDEARIRRIQAGVDSRHVR